MEFSVFFIFAGIIIAVVILSQVFSKTARIKRKLKKAGYKKMEHFNNGESAKIVGTVEVIGKPLIAPLSGRECAVYSIRIEEKVSSGKSTRWKTRVEEEVYGKFVIKEGDKFAFINDENRSCYIVKDRNFSSGFLKDATETLESYLNKKGYNSKGFLGVNRTLRYKEGVIEKGEEIAVTGVGNWIDAAAVHLPEKYTRVLEIKSSDKEAVFLSDDTDTTKKKTIKKKARARDYDIERRYRK